MKLTQAEPSIFLGKVGLEYFEFEEDFMESNMRCIPMAVRFKLDTVRIKLKLSAWAKFSSEEKMALAVDPCVTEAQQVLYAVGLENLILLYTGQQACELPANKVVDAWTAGNQIPQSMREKALEFGWEVGLPAWNTLSDLQRYSLLKLTNPSHQNKNFPIAMREFGLV
jgi:hypothetical protein